MYFKLILFINSWYSGNVTNVVIWDHDFNLNSWYYGCIRLCVYELSLMHFLLFYNKCLNLETGQQNVIKTKMGGQEWGSNFRVSWAPKLVK